ncbi:MULTISPECIES: hypothetical protein [unclassified Mesorhizobium]|uniref:DUF6894 family protein n=1 Tax=unclassified Mesorhizobium TaxID=325217 RepID=UPI000BB083F1|nr:MULTISPECIES: hypothetical protein [unclassified Mesorhizobium]TGT56826.1 hypothetical protein EN813_041120 [Mesorhizobium sp. M00.F.Ca.ET.170.01.1.1]AZO08594.1 hypothetical protein EJ074_05225 [Mesorhizobium sp. M3A.F.Ca.ET.080.04.2.1]PBB85472.1 hypothetical protein CK216_17605 [Mesorhizobium sp. WSM3876]RWB71711.1 MAG: hypothetical protein EOQ49_14435 [Mesorhizobium sp.]RWB85037.1 MAG: hypothetical protein EOQ52_22475 [Mesorhizobium sp.]
MPLYFFDISANGHRTADDLGVHLDSPDDVRKAVSWTLPAIAMEEKQRGDRSYIASVRDERGQVVYTATLTFTDSWH